MKFSEVLWGGAMSVSVAFLFCGLAAYPQQAVPAKPPAAKSATTEARPSVLADGHAPASTDSSSRASASTDAAGELTSDEHIALLELQKRNLQAALTITDLQNQYKQANQQLSDANKEFNDALAKAQARLGKDWLINANTLAVTKVPAQPAAKPAAEKK
jgi:hypothetical protein